MRSTALESLTSAIRLVITNFRLFVWLAVVPILLTSLARAALIDVFAVERTEIGAAPVAPPSGAPGLESPDLPAFIGIEPAGVLSLGLVTLVMAAPFICVWMRIGALGLDRMAADEIGYRFGRREIACLRAMLLVLVGCFILTALISLPAMLMLGGGSDGTRIAAFIGAAAAVAFSLRVSPYVVAAALDRSDITLQKALAITRGQGLRLLGASMLVLFGMFPLLVVGAMLSGEITSLFSTDFARNTAEAIITLVLDYISYAIFAAFFARVFIASAPPAPVNDPA